jgi:protein-tyrosine-phosphatase
MNMSNTENKSENKIERILFVCTGNTCRSPMAEALCNKYLPDVEALSAGIGTMNGLPASIGAIDAMNSMGLNIDHHRSRSLTSYLLADADLVLCMSASHKDTILKALPEYADKVFTLTEFVGEEGDIPDPFGGDYETYIACAERLDQLIGKLADKLNEE